MVHTRQGIMILMCLEQNPGSHLIRIFNYKILCVLPFWKHVMDNSLNNNGVRAKQVYYAATGKNHFERSGRSSIKKTNQQDITLLCMFSSMKIRHKVFSKILKASRKFWSFSKLLEHSGIL